MTRSIEKLQKEYLIYMNLFTVLMVLFFYVLNLLGIGFKFFFLLIAAIAAFNAVLLLTKKMQVFYWLFPRFKPLMEYERQKLGSQLTRQLRQQGIALIVVTAMMIIQAFTFSGDPVMLDGTFFVIFGGAAFMFSNISIVYHFQKLQKLPAQEYQAYVKGSLKRGIVIGLVVGVAVLVVTLIFSVTMI